MPWRPESSSDAVLRGCTSTAPEEIGLAGWRALSTVGHCPRCGADPGACRIVMCRQRKEPCHAPNAGPWTAGVPEKRRPGAGAIRADGSGIRRICASDERDHHQCHRIGSERPEYRVGDGIKSLETEQHLRAQQRPTEWAGIQQLASQQARCHRRGHHQRVAPARRVRWRHRKCHRIGPLMSRRLASSMSPASCSGWGCRRRRRTRSHALAATAALHPPIGRKLIYHNLPSQDFGTVRS